jgi:hypothetical protein
VPNRGESKHDANHAQVNLPIKPFLYSLDQIATILDTSEQNVKQNYIHFSGRSINLPTHDQIVARNIAAPGAKPEWRVAERELIRWLRRKGFYWHERGYISH